MSRLCFLIGVDERGRGGSGIVRVSRDQYRSIDFNTMNAEVETKAGNLGIEWLANYRFVPRSK